MTRALRLLPLLLLLLVPACSEPADNPDVRRGDAMSPGDGVGADGDAATDIGTDNGDPCGACASYERCFANTCVPRLGPCMTHDDCPGDSYCAADGQCVPYGVPATRTVDDTCRRAPIPGAVQPAVQCEWIEPPSGDPSAGYSIIYTALMVAELNLDGSAGRIDPSIVGITFGGTTTRRGILRVWSGRTCTEQFRIGLPGSAADEPNEPGYGSQIAIGDLNGDLQSIDDVVTGHPEIVTLHRLPTGDLGIIAYGIDDLPGMTPPHRLARRWIGRRCDLAGEPAVRLAEWTMNAGPSLVDLDDDGRPEVLYERQVFDSRGCALNDPTGTTTNYLRLGMLTVAVDVDLDAVPELVAPDGVFAWNRAMRRWDVEAYWAPTAADRAVQRNGHVAVADFGRYPVPAPLDAARRIPEIAVVSNQDDTYASGSTSQGTVRLQTVGGRVVFGPVPVYGAGSPGGHGGPPTAADFDGDGWPEIGVAGGRTYAVYDPDCAAAPPPERTGGRCDRPAGMTAVPGILWWRASQDASSSATGSSVFDFNGDGRAEAVYRDECYLRVYDGASGTVLYSAAAPSGTGYELPTLVDVDGDFATEIVVPRAGPIGCPATDPIAPAGTMAMLPVRNSGFMVLRDVSDRWVPSRPIWNQHAYHVTNVEDDGRIPRSSMARRNWEEMGLNNFRQNTQGALRSIGLADLTVSLVNATELCSAMGRVTLRARVCNRGTNPVADGAVLRFQQPTSMGMPPRTICDARTTRFLAPGTCTSVQCDGDVLATGARSIEVVADPDGTIADCHPRNNRGIIPLGGCPG